MTQEADPQDDTRAHFAAWETCPACRGYIMHANIYTGEPDDGCEFCDGRSWVRRRDESGRFVGKEARQ